MLTSLDLKLLGTSLSRSNRYASRRCRNVATSDQSGLVMMRAARLSGLRPTVSGIDDLYEAANPASNLWWRGKLRC